MVDENEQKSWLAGLLVSRLAGDKRGRNEQPTGSRELMVFGCKLKG